MKTTLHTKYRPATFDEVMGHADIVESIKSVLDADSSHAFLLEGEAGCGKSTIARIIASYVGGSDNLIEVDAATYTGIDAMRQLTESLIYKPLGVSSKKVVILDECHALSQSSWQSLLKCVEDPPPHVYWIFCTTNAAKVPKTIKTRCASYHFDPLSDDELFSLVEMVAVSEKFLVANDEGAIDLIVQESNGSPRQALVNLSACQGCTTRKEVAALLKSVQSSNEVIDLCRLLVKGQGLSWAKVAELIRNMDIKDVESVRIQIINYLSKVALNAKSDEAALKYLNLVECFSTPYNNSDKVAPLLLSIGQVLYGE